MDNSHPDAENAANAVIKLNLDKSKSELNWTASTNLEKGISKTVEWAKEEINLLNQIEYLYEGEK